MAIFHTAGGALLRLIRPVADKLSVFWAEASSRTRSALAGFEPRTSVGRKRHPRESAVVAPKYVILRAKPGNNFITLRERSQNCQTLHTTYEDADGKIANMWPCSGWLPHVWALKRGASLTPTFSDTFMRAPSETGPGRGRRWGGEPNFPGQLVGPFTGTTMARETAAKERAINLERKFVEQRE